MSRWISDRESVAKNKEEATIERPPLETIREHFRDAPIVVVIDYALSLESRVAALEADREAFAREVVKAVISRFVTGPSGPFHEGLEITRAIAAVKAARGEA